MHIVLISGLSGSGKSVALRALEDAGHYCVDNLPARLLPLLTSHLADAGIDRLAVAVDARSVGQIDTLPDDVERLRRTGHEVALVFLDAKDETLIRRFSETRRRHPLSDEGSTLEESIAHERKHLEVLAQAAHRIDSSDLSANALRAWIRDFVRLEAREQLILLFQSFGFKHGIPLDADLVFDVRCLPNPHYDPQLRPLTGRDEAVIRFLEKQRAVGAMAESIGRFIEEWLPAYLRDNRAYLTVAIGCTGGQHRSVYLAERLARRFAQAASILVRHRELA